MVEDGWGAFLHPRSAFREGMKQLRFATVTRVLYGVLFRGDGQTHVFHSTDVVLRLPWTPGLVLELEVLFLPL